MSAFNAGGVAHGIQNTGIQANIEGDKFHKTEHINLWE